MMGELSIKYDMQGIFKKLCINCNKQGTGGIVYAGQRVCCTDEGDN